MIRLLEHPDVVEAARVALPLLTAQPEAEVRADEQKRILRAAECQAVTRRASVDGPRVWSVTIAESTAITARVVR